MKSFTLLFLVGALGGTAQAAGTADYSVPVPPQLAAVSSFSIDGVQLTGTDGTSKLNYNLPADLTGGKDVNIDLKGPTPVEGGGFVPFSGPNAKASCTMASQTHLLCMIQYQKTVFGSDPQQFSANAQTFLSQKFSADPLLKNRLAVQERFQNEPAGVLSFEIQ